MWFNFVFPESHRPSILNIDYPHYRIRAHALRCVSFCLMQHGSSGMNWEDELVDKVSLQVFRAKRFRGETWKCKITLLLESKLLVWQLFSASCPKRLDKTTRPNVWITGKRRRWANYECVCVSCSVQPDSISHWICNTQWETDGCGSKWEKHHVCLVVFLW